MKSLLLALPLMLPVQMLEPKPFQGYIPPRFNLAVCMEENDVCTIHERYLEALRAKAKQCQAMRDERNL